MRVIGPMALFPDAVLQWNIKSTLSVDENAFVLFELLHPKPDIVFFGYGGKTQSLQSSGRASHVCISWQNFKNVPILHTVTENEYGPLTK